MRDVVRTVLALAYHFPPIGGGGVQRSVKFVRYLPDHGYRCTVVTGPGKAEDRWTPEDETLLGELPAGTRVLRVPGPTPPPAGGWRGRAERLSLVERRFSRWWTDGAVAVGREAGAVDLVYASMSPWESADVAARLSAELRVPWVADLRDPWALDELMVHPTAFHRRRELRRMGRALASADAIVMNTRVAAERLRTRFPHLRTRRVSVVTNGFDRADFAGPPPPRDTGAFRVVHSGYLHAELGLEHRRSARVRRALGGDPYDVDILTRSHVYLIQAIDLLRERSPELAAPLELHLVGVLSEADRRIADRPYVVLHGYQAHARTVELLRGADLLFLPMQNLLTGAPASIVPGKTYEYLAAGRPILAAVPPGDARDLLAEAGGAVVCAPDDVDGLAAALERELARRAAGEPPALPAPEVADRYERRRLTAALAEIFDDVLGVAAAPERAALP